MFEQCVGKGGSFPMIPVFSEASDDLGSEGNRPGARLASGLPVTHCDTEHIVPNLNPLQHSFSQDHTFAGVLGDQYLTNCRWRVYLLGLQGAKGQALWCCSQHPQRSSVKHVHSSS